MQQIAENEPQIYAQKLLATDGRLFAYAARDPFAQSARVFSVVHSRFEVCRANSKPLLVVVMRRETSARPTIAYLELFARPLACIQLFSPVCLLLAAALERLLHCVGRLIFMLLA